MFRTLYVYFNVLFEQILENLLRVRSQKIESDGQIGHPTEHDDVDCIVFALYDHMIHCNHVEKSAM